TGLIPSLFPISASGYAPVAYQWIFATIAAALALGLAIYVTSRDVKPSAGPMSFKASNEERPCTGR
ncbi:MAG TPA: hypothetical protein VF051_02380, partial [Hyphomicrobiaceae bacterium]